MKTVNTIVGFRNWLGKNASVICWLFHGVSERWQDVLHKSLPIIQHPDNIERPHTEERILQPGPLSLLPMAFSLAQTAKTNKHTCLISTLLRARHDDALPVVCRGLMEKPVDGVVLIVPVGSRRRGRTGRWDWCEHG